MGIFPKMVCMIVPSCRIVHLKNHFEHLNIEQAILLLSL